jgi:hypothetical protein
VSIPQLDVVGDGGVFTTVEDLAKWDANFDTGAVGGRDAIRQMHQPGVLTDGRNTGYALGLSVGLFGGARVISHSGAYGGYRSTYLRFPDERLSVITLCNVSAMSSHLAEQVATVYLGGSRAGDGFDPFPSSMRRIIPADPQSLKRLQIPDEQVWLEGKYFSAELEMEVTVRSDNARLVMRRPGASDLTFSRVSRDLFATSDQVSIKVERDAFGTVSGFLLSMNRVRDLRFVKTTGIVGAFGVY